MKKTEAEHGFYSTDAFTVLPRVRISMWGPIGEGLPSLPTVLSVSYKIRRLKDWDIILFIPPL